MNPQYPQQPQYGAPLPPATKTGTPVWVWILAAIAGLILLAGIALTATLWFIGKKAKEAASNPVAAMARLAALANPNVEVLDVDESAGKVTIKDKQSGKTITVTTDQLQQGKIEFESEEGKATIGAGTDIKMPSFVPEYPGAKYTGNFSARTEKGNSGQATFETSDSLEQVKSFFIEKLEAQGFKIETQVATGEGAMLLAKSGDGKDVVQITIGKGEKTTGSVIFSQSVSEN